MGYSSLRDIDRDNVSELELAWTWDTGEEPLPGPRLPVPGERVRPGSFEVTPLVLDDTMYLSTPYNRVVALDPSTGREIWVYDPKTVEWGQPPNGTGFVHRGVAIWTGGERRRDELFDLKIAALDQVRHIVEKALLGADGEQFG